MSCLTHWDNYQGDRAVVETVLPPSKKTALGGIVPMDFGSVMLRDVGYIGVTGWY